MALHSKCSRRASVSRVRISVSPPNSFSPQFAERFRGQRNAPAHLARVNTSFNRGVAKPVKALDFDSSMRRFDSYHPRHFAFQ